MKVEYVKVEYVKVEYVKVEYVKVEHVKVEYVKVEYLTAQWRCWRRSDCAASPFGAFYNACEFKSDYCAQAHWHTESSVCFTADAFSCSFAVFHSRSMFAVFVHCCVSPAWNDCIAYVRVTT